MSHNSIIQLDNLNFSYKKGEPILRDLNLNVTAGSIYGFLGANGAGKSTTIRTILGLMKPQSGKISLFGNQLKKNDSQTYSKIGSLIEAPSLYQHLNAKDNLRIVCKYHNISTDGIDAVLERVGLLDAKKKTVKKYSMGMKQRLGLAIAIIHNPDLLILDEPTNGLDPNGINEIRNIIVDLKNEGKTIILSSHLLSEIERIATHVGIIKNGKLVFEGEISELEALKSGQSIVKIETTNSEKAKTLLSDFEVIAANTNDIQVQVPSKKELNNIIKLLVLNDIELGEIQFQKNDLESLFIDITNQ